MEHQTSEVERNAVNFLKYRLKEYERLPIYVVEFHNDALPFIYRSIGAKYLPINGITMIHLDSHPDLGIPSAIASNLCFDKDKLFDQLSIENWIMPSAYAGIFKNVVWVKPSWADQISEGHHILKIGEDKASKEIKVDSPLPYFIGEAVFSRKESLNEVKDLNLEVVTLGHEEENLEDLSLVKLAIQKYVTAGDRFILDIDLDFFSTKNPFLDIYEKADTYNILKTLYTFKISTDLEHIDADHCTKLNEERLKQLNQLKAVFTYLDEHLTLEDAPEEITSLPCYLGVKALYEKLQSCYPDTEIEWMIVHDAGCTIDEKELPHHVTEKTQLEYYLKVVFPKFLDDLPGRPTIITISRSSVDDYCPKEDVDFIQDTVLAALENKFQSIEVTLDYCNEEDEEMPVLVGPEV